MCLDVAPDSSSTQTYESCPTERGREEGSQHHCKAGWWKPLQQEHPLPIKKVLVERKEGEGPLCFGLSPLPFAQRDVAKGAGGGKCCPTGQALEGQRGAKIHQAPGGRACAKMASKTNGTTRWGWAGGAGSVFTPHSWRYRHEERTELWLRSGCSRARAVQPGWGWGHALPLALGKEGEKSHGKSAGGPLQVDTLPACVHGPGSPQMRLHMLALLLVLHHPHSL